MSGPQPRRRPLDPFFAPASVAVIGATEAKASVGRIALTNLGSFHGPIYPVTEASITLAETVRPDVVYLSKPNDRDACQGHLS
jgi:acyl-CoA synthetase (NDP forming)